jgi:putative transposase
MLDQLVAGVRTPAELEAVLRALKRAVTERVLRAELTDHLDYPDGAARPAGTTNARNGTTPKTVLTEEGALPLAIPCDRAGSFTPQLVSKGVRRLPGFDQKVLSRYARGRTVRELQAHLEECYQVPVSPDLISAVTAEILPELQAWRLPPAAAPARAGLHRGGLRCLAREDSRRRAGAAQGGLPGAGGDGERDQGGARLLARAGRGGQLLAARHE